MTSYPKPGRGAWRLTGGLLPAKPGSDSKAGYYRMSASGEIPIGAGWYGKADTTHHAEAVWYGVRALQGMIGASVDGWFGPETDARVRASQKACKIEVDGIAGRGTLRALLTPLVEHIAAISEVPEDVLGGLLTNESALDPAAVGTNGQDHGLAQINLGAHPDITLAQAMDPSYAITWTAGELQHTYATWKGRTTADPWDIAIANHNSPLLAKRWAVSGTPPVEKYREFQISEYVDRVRAAW